MRRPGAAQQRGCLPLGYLQEVRAGTGPLSIHGQEREQEPQICRSPSTPPRPITPGSLFPTSMCFSLRLHL